MTPADPPAQVAVRLRGVRKRYGQTTAVADLDLDVHCGEIVGLIFDGNIARVSNPINL